MRKIRNNELNRLTPEDFKSVRKSPIVIVLDNVRSANNIGSVFRTSDAYLIEKIYLCGISCCPPNKDIRKTALGAEDCVEWEYIEDTASVVEVLKRADYKVYAIEQVEGSISLEAFTVQENEKYAIIFGNEVNGVDQHVVDLCHGAIEIPQFGTKHSLNISVSCGIVIWDLYSKVFLQKNDIQQ